MTRTVTQSWSRSWKVAVAICVLSGSCALAQTANDASRTSDGGVHNARIQAAHAEWRRLSQNEINCVDRSLHAQRSSLWLVIQRGIDPSDSRAAGVRAACRTQARAPNASPHGASQALAASVESVADKAAAGKALADKIAAAKAAVEKAAGDKVGADKAAAEKAAAEKAAAEKAAADKVAADKAAADKAADKAAADKAAADKAAADKTAAEKVATDKAAAEKVAADKATADKAAADKAAADKAAAEKAAIDSAKADVERAKAGLMKAEAEAERPRKEAERTIADAAFAYSAAEARISFIYGLVSGPILFGLGGFAFLFVNRKRSGTVTQSDAAPAVNVSSESQDEFNRLVNAVLDEQQKRRARKRPEAMASAAEQRVDEAAVH